MTKIPAGCHLINLITKEKNPEYFFAIQEKSWKKVLQYKKKILKKFLQYKKKFCNAKKTPENKIPLEWDVCFQVMFFLLPPDLGQIYISRYIFGYIFKHIFLWYIRHCFTGEAHFGSPSGCRRLGARHLGTVPFCSRTFGCRFELWRKNNEAGNSLNAVGHEPVPTRVLNSTASEVSYKPKQRSYGKTKLKKLNKL